MLPAFLITLREVIEATLIVATILGILTKLKETKNIKTVYLATLSATSVSIALFLLASTVGVKVQELYSGKAEQLIEGTLMVFSALFMSWAVFWLHKYFGRKKLALLQKVTSTIAEDSQRSLFVLVFTAVFREGFEIVLFLSTIYLTSNPMSVFMGVAGGVGVGLFVSLSFFTATLKMPVYKAFQLTSVLLILFAAGLLARGVHEFVEAGAIPEFFQVTLEFLPQSGHFMADITKAIFGLTHTMDSSQLGLYAIYIAFMRWYLYQRKQPRVVSNV